MFSLQRVLIRKIDGATAIEFSLVAFPFILMIIGIIEIALMFTAATLVEGATGTASRLVRTCQLQNMSGDPQENFTQAFCEHASVLVECEDRLRTEAIVMPGGSFMNVSNFEPNFDENGVMVPAGFTAGTANDVILVRASYKYEMLTPGFSELLTGGQGGATFMSTTVLQIEPCEFE
jgi:Flp pilus assembly protein TadG